MRPVGRVSGGYAGEVVREGHGLGTADGGGGGGGGAGASGGVARCASRHSGHEPGCPLGVAAKTVRLSRDIRTVSWSARYTNIAASAALFFTSSKLSLSYVSRLVCQV